jgi:hypothetical protein
MVQDRNIFVGVDPGVNGALASIYMTPEMSAPRLFAAVDLNGLDGLDMPRTEVALASVVEQLEQAGDIIVERQQASPQMGRSSAFTLGFRAGMINGLLLGLGRVAFHVWPVTWRTAFGLGGGVEGKAASMAMARELVGPEASAMMLTSREAGVALDRHDVADAVLLAWWGYRQTVDDGDDTW